MDKFREEYNNWNSLIELISELTKLVDSSREKEALDLRDRILNDFVKNYSEPMWGYLNLEAAWGCPLQVLFKLSEVERNGEAIVVKGEYSSEFETFEIDNFQTDFANARIIVFVDGTDWTDTRLFPFSEYKKTWWLKEDKSE